MDSYGQFEINVDQLANDPTMDSTNFHSNMNNCSYSSSMGKLDFFKWKLKLFWKEARWEIITALTKL